MTSSPFRCYTPRLVVVTCNFLISPNHLGPIPWIHLEILKPNPNARPHRPKRDPLKLYVVSFEMEQTKGIASR